LSLLPGDRLNPGGPASRWAPRSKAKTAKGYGRFLTWLDLRGELHSESASGDCVNPALIAAYVDDLLAQGNGTYTALCRVEELYNALRVMAPSTDWRWFRDFVRQLREEILPSRRKLEQLQHAGDLLELGFRLMEEAETADNATTLRRAERYRDGFIIALLAFVPLRIGNLAAIKIGRHLTKGSAGHRIDFARNETKNRRHLEYDVPLELAQSLERYTDHYRPILLSCGGRYVPSDIDDLWISREGTVMHVGSLRNAVKRRTRQAFGIAVSPHRFRDAAATDMAEKDPKHVLAAASVLGNNPITMMRHYNQAQAHEADRRYHALIAELRRTEPESGA
jgi:integrase